LYYSNENIFKVLKITLDIGLLLEIIGDIFRRRKEEKLSFLIRTGQCRFTAYCL